MSDVLERFLRYVQIDTQSQDGTGQTPSTAKQLDLARLLVSELNELGLQDVHLDRYGVVTATLPATISGPAPVVGFLAHMDTSPDLTGTNVRPQVVHYTGGDIVLNSELDLRLSPAQFPELSQSAGQTLVTTDGTTLLGADDKAGVAEIMAALRCLVENPGINHGTIRVAFTPDEEIGHGVDNFDVAGFGADFAYTLDGGALGELQYENFNAAAALVRVRGRSVHPGTAKDKMINAIQVAMDFNALLPPQARPEFTSGYEGFYHPVQIQGNIEQVELRYIVREHDRQKFETQLRVLEEAAAFLRRRYGDGVIELETREQYANMRVHIEKVMHVVELAKEAMLALDIQPVIEPIRGGTDGAVLTYKGLPTPNLFTGGHNYHGRYEYVVVETMEKAVDVILEIARRATSR